MSIKTPITTVSLDDLLSALEWVSGDMATNNAAYISRHYGSIHWVSSDFEFDVELPDDINDSSLYIAVPNKNELNLGRSIALGFAEEHLPQLAQTVYGYFRHRGAYGNFKDLLERENCLQAWYDYEAQAVENALREWCGERGIKLKA